MPPRVTRQRNESNQTPVVSAPETNHHEHQPTRQGLTIGLFGKPKSGKTRLVCTFPKPMLLIGSEDGTRSVATSKRKVAEWDGNPAYRLYRLDRDTGVDFVCLRRPQDIETICGAVQSLGRYRTVALDHATGLYELVIKDYLGLSEVPISKSFGMASREQWGSMGAILKDLLYRLLQLSEIGLDVAIIGHEKTVTHESKNVVLPPYISYQLSEKVEGWLSGAVESNCETYIEHEMQVSVVDDGKGGTQEIHLPTGKSEYRLRLKGGGVYNTGLRTIGDELPDYIANPTYDKIVAVIEGRTP